MKRLTKTQIDLTADTIVALWLCRFGERNADKLSLAVRRKMRLIKVKT